MYFKKQKDAIMQKIENGVSVSEVSAETGIPEATINEWIIKKEIKAIIDELIDNGKFDEAKQKAEELTQGTSETIKLSIFSRIARKEGDIAKEKELLEKRLQLEPDNVKVISSLERIAREEGNIKRERELLERQLELEPDSLIALTNLIKIARKEGNIAREKELLERRLQIEPDNVKAMSSLARIAREEGDRAREKELLERQLELEPDNLIAMSILIRIAREEENRAREKELLEKQLEVKPDIKAMSSLIRIAREEGDMAREKELLERQLELEPDNVITMSSLARIAKEEGDRAKEKELLEKRLELEPDSLIAMSRLARIAKEEGDEIRERELLERILQIEPNNKNARKFLRWSKNREEKRLGLTKIASKEEMDVKYIDRKTKQEVETLMLGSQEQVKETPISLARKMIYESQDIASASERIKELIEGENEADRQLVIAELYYHTGLIDRAEKSLKAYKRTFGENAKGDEVRAVNKALEIIRMKRPRGFEWQNFWDTRLNVAQTEQPLRENKKPSNNALDEGER